jgi:two-component system CheB/CheR fusion protein
MTAATPYVVGVGASAGGIDAFRRFFENMPADTGLAFVVVLHLAADRKSMLPEILARWTGMTVSEAHDGDALLPDTVLVVPPGAVASLNDGKLALHLLQPHETRETAPIDAFFDSLAHNLNENAIGVVLSGTGHDGALGLKAIKTRGGLTLAQGVNGSAPEYSGMPDSAVAAGAVDLLVSVEQMPASIIATRAMRSEHPDQSHQPAGDMEAVRLAICEVIRSGLGHDFLQYKRQTFVRRVERRMQVLRLTSFDEYLARLKADREQVVLLFRDLLISVTSFFRDTKAFEVMEREVIPRLFETKDALGEVRVWVPGCATGEEAYSLAILLLEHLDTASSKPKVRIFATDIDEVAIATARAGRYPATLLDGISAERRARFFIEGTAGYVVRQDVRELCTFSAHNLIRDPPFSRVDFISCRNLLIYMDNDLQDRVISIFHYALVAGGILMLGISETVGRHERLFKPLDRTQRIFLRREGPSEAPSLSVAASRDHRAPGPRAGAAADSKAHWPRAVGQANRRVLERFASAFVVVDADGDVMHFSSHTGRFLEPAHGSPTSNLFELARPGWSLELRSALRRCIDTGCAVEHERAVIMADGQLSPPVKLVIEPLAEPGTETLYMVVFAEVEPARPAADSEPSAGADNVVWHLQRENGDLREQLRAVHEEHATTIEELRSSNEELQSVNEELQSTNEELETSREEIQSINEELNTVNGQLSSRLEQLDRSNSDLKNLFDSTRVATVFLDPFMVIRSFTPEIASIYNLIPSDLGRPLSDIVSRLNYTELRDDVQIVRQTQQPLEKRVERTDGSAHYLMRILPYRSPDSSIDGSLITFVDVTSIVLAEQHQRLLVDELNHRVRNMLTVVISLASNTLKRASSLDHFSSVFLGRIHALAAAYALLSRHGWAPIPVREIVVEELKPFMSDERSNVVLTGDPVMVEPRAALALGMAVHELTTNAVKHGSLSVPDGTVTVGWTIRPTDTGKQFFLQWIERNGPPVTAPEVRGFGLTLIERSFAHDVSGSVSMDFAPQGITATLCAPLSGTIHEGKPT